MKRLETKPDHILKGIAYACTAFFMFTVMQAFNKLLVGQHNVIEIAFWRNLLALLPCLVYIAWTRKPELLKTKMPKTMALRVIVGTFGLMMTFEATQRLPIANATVIFFTSTIMIPVMAHFFLREHIGLQRWIAVAIGMSGVLLVAQPSAEYTMMGVLIALGAATVHATIQVAIRAMKSESPFTITLYFFAGGVVIPALALPWAFHMPTMETIPYLLAIGVTGGLGQYFLTRGFQLAPASLLSPFNYTGLIWATGLDILIWNYVPGWPVFAGGAIIMSSYLFILYRERKTSANGRAYSSTKPPAL